MSRRTFRPASGAEAEMPAVCGRIKHWRNRARMDQKDLAAQVGVTANAVSNWENGRARPDVALLPRICQALNITMYQLFGMEDPESRITEGERVHLEKYRALTEENRYVADRAIDAMLKVQKESVPRLRELVFYSRTLAAGTGDPSEFDDGGDSIYLYDSPRVRKADCVFRVNGDSMEPMYHSGDMVLVKRLIEAADINPGEIGAFISGNETYIKEYRKDGLYSLNAAYPVMRFDEGEEVYLIGRVIGTADPEDIASPGDVEKYLAHCGQEK